MSAAGGTVVDRRVLLDVFTEDSGWGEWSQTYLTRAAQRGALILNAVVLAEIAPRFERVETLRSTLPSMAVVEEIPLEAAFLAGHAHAALSPGGWSARGDSVRLPDRRARRRHRASPAHTGSSTGRHPTSPAPV